MVRKTLTIAAFAGLGIGLLVPALVVELGLAAASAATAIYYLLR
jgi:hypothetical protein